MRKLSRLAALGLSGILALGLAACGGGTGTSDTPSGTESPAAGTESPAAAGETFVVGICQQMQHVALDEATRGFIETLEEKLGTSVEIQEQNASGEAANCTTIINNFVSQGVDLILCNGTTALQAAVAATGDIPILGTSITDYATALQMENWTGTSGTNISGTTDLAPLEDQAQMLLDLFPDAQNVGLLYCSAEPNSVYQVNIVREYLEGQGLTCTDYTFSDSNDLASVTQTACASSDVIYIPTDNTAASYASTIHNVVVPAGVPVITGDTGTCSGCGVAVLGIDYYELGQITGEMAYEILVEGADPATMEVRSAPTPTKMYNPSICEELGITPPEDYTALES